MLSDRRARQAQRRGRPARLGTVIATPRNMLHNPVFYARADEYGDGDYQTGPARYGYSRYAREATYGDAAITAAVARYGYVWYGRGSAYGSGGTLATAESTDAVYGIAHYGRGSRYGG